VKGTALGSLPVASVRLLRGAFGDAVIATIVIVVAFVAALNYLSKTGVSEFYEILFAPAVNFAARGNTKTSILTKGNWLLSCSS
jgi:hypothetical protein